MRTRGGTSADQAVDALGRPLPGALVEVREAPSPTAALVVELTADEYGMTPAFVTPDRLDGLDVWSRASRGLGYTWGPWVRVPGDLAATVDVTGLVTAQQFQAHVDSPTPHPTYDSSSPLVHYNANRY